MNPGFLTLSTHPIPLPGAIPPMLLQMTNRCESIATFGRWPAAAHPGRQSAHHATKQHAIKLQHTPASILISGFSGVNDLLIATRFQAEL